MATDDSIHAKFRLDRSGFSLDVDLAIPSNGVTALFGPSGCGKTTVLRCVAGLERPPGGRLEFGGQVWQDDKIWIPPHRRPFGFVFQQPHLFAHLSVRGNLEYGWKRLPKSEQKDLAPVVELLGIGHLLDRKPERLSGGEAQRVGIARALALSPRVLLMDEPLSALDTARKREILPYLERLRDEAGIPIVYVTHSPDEVARLADHLVILREGRVAASGPLRELQARLDLPRLVGDEVGVVLGAVVGEVDRNWNLARSDFIGGCLWARDHGLAVGRRTRIKVLARDVSLSVAPPARSSIQNVLTGTVEALGDDEHPGLALVRVDLGGSTILARLTRRAVHEMEIQPGRHVWVQVKTVALAE
jgi:molybdate transport system ATP-binding protein